MKNHSKQSTNNNPNKSIDRRRALITIGNTVTGIVGVGSLGVTYKFLFPDIRLEPPSSFQVKNPENIQPNSVVFDEEHHLFIVRNEQGYFYTLSAICTHLGCTVNWRPVSVPGHPDGVISCPCHGSIYDKMGNVLSGPAPRSLDKYHIILKDDKLVIDTDEIVDEKDMLLKI